MYSEDYNVGLCQLLVGVYVYQYTVFVYVLCTDLLLQ